MDYRALAEAALMRAEGLVAEQRAVMADESLSDAEKRERVEKMDADVLAAEGEARSLIEQGEREAEHRALFDRAGSLGVPQSKEDRTNADLNAQFRALAAGEVNEVRVRGGAGLYLPVDETRAQTTANFGATNHIPRDFVGQVIEALRESSPIFQLARILTTAGGEPLDYPKKTQNFTLSSGSYTPGENTAYSKGEVTFDKFTLGATKYGAIVEVTKELIDDSAIDIASIVAQDMGTEVGRKVATDAVADLRTDVSPGRTSATDGSFLADDLLELYHSLVSGYRRDASWLMNDATALRIRKMRDGETATTGNYIWQPGLQAGQPDVLLSRPVYTDYNVETVPTTTGTKEVAFFGDFSKFIIRQVNDLRIVRSDEYGWDRDVVAFKVTWRGDFGLSDTSAVKSLAVAKA